MKRFVKYSEFRKRFGFEMPPLTQTDSGIYFNGELVEDEAHKVAEGQAFVNIGYGFKTSKSRVLSNLYPMSFVFRGKRVASLEGVLQGIKYKDKRIQNLVLRYSGLDAYHTRVANEQEPWAAEGKLFWQGHPMDRYGEEYQLFLDELYYSVLKNPIYVQALKATGEKYLLHHIGKVSQSETVLTRYEFENRLNSLREYVKQHNL